MSYNFSTIDGLFRPNYKVYKAFTKTPEVELESLQPVQITYKPQDIQRVKSVVSEVPKQEDFEVNSEEKDTPQNEINQQLKDLYPKQDYTFFMQELEKFIEKNPEYKSIKNSLQNLAALESSYKMDITNTAGSGALGWFQFMDGTRNAYNTQTREQFAYDPQAQLLAAAQHYTKLQNEIRARGGDPDDFVTMYGAWWRPASAYAYLENPDYDFRTKYNESFQQIRQRAHNFVNKYGKSVS